MYIRALFISTALVLSSPTLVTAGDDFDGFKQKQINLPKSYKKLKGVEGIDAKYVHSFSIYGGECRSAKYTDNSGKSDCDHGSVRSELREKKSGKSFYSAFPQPTPVWYGFDILIPKSYPTLGQQKSAFNIFAQWKSENCPHTAVAHWTRPGHENALFLVTYKSVVGSKNHECDVVATKKIASMPSIKGKWTRVEMFVNWSEGRDGVFDVYINGAKKLSHRGPNLDPNNINEAGKRSNKNYFSFGTYLANSRGSGMIRSGTVYYANVHRSKKRVDLFR
ncbi:heparin lyase I family protein [uncultured Ruegeria sp.]|uniref:heparin lyase I family protein n=1 Tax=uncultured Ruegeria sp. TaxID=259304 RepID=UPI00262CF4A8|nr:heparin lyase I family protein [uncultured Ruegeria sp.]